MKFLFCSRFHVKTVFSVFFFFLVFRLSFVFLSMNYNEGDVSIPAIYSYNRNLIKSPNKISIAIDDQKRIPWLHSHIPVHLHIERSTIVVFNFVQGSLFQHPQSQIKYTYIVINGNQTSFMFRPIIIGNDDKRQRFMNGNPQKQTKIIAILAFDCILRVRALFFDI